MKLGVWVIQYVEPARYNPIDLLDVGGKQVTVQKITVPEDFCDATDDMELLKKIFEYCNIGRGARQLLYSLSVGDVVVIYRNKTYKAYRCDAVGWELIDKVGLMG